MKRPHLRWTMPLLAVAVWGFPVASGGDVSCQPLEPTDLSTVDFTVKHRVRCVYLSPSDRPFRDCLRDRLDTFIRMAQRFFQEEMAREGYRDAWGQGKTFPFEMDSAGRWNVVLLQGEHETSWYHEDWTSWYPGTKAFSEMCRRMTADFTRENVVLFIYDLATFEDGGVQYAGQGGAPTPDLGPGAGYTLQGAHFLGIGFDTVAVRIDDQPAMFERTASSGITDYDGNGSRHVLNLSEYSSTNVGAGIHELAHTFNLGHDFTDYDGDGIENNLVGNGFRRFSGRYTEKGFLPPTGLGPLHASEADKAVLFNTGEPPIELFSDDGWPGTSAVGSWKPSGAPYPYGTASLYGWEVGASYSYEIPIPVPGEYEVTLRWTAWPSRQPSVPVDIVHASGTARVAVDQTRDAGRWNAVGRYRFDGTALVTIRAVGVGSTCADGVRLTRVFGSAPPPPSPVAVVLDNGQPGTTARGSWSISGGPEPYGTSSLYSKTVGSTYEFLVPLPAAGSWDVELWWTEWPSRLAAVPVEIAHAGGVAAVEVDQRADGGQWNSVGTWAFGTSAKVTIRSPGGGTACADAVRLVPASGPVIPPAPGAVVLDDGQAGTTARGSWSVSGGPDPYATSSLYSKTVGSTYEFLLPLPASGAWKVELWWTEWPSRLAAVPVEIAHAGGVAVVDVDQRSAGGQWNLLGTWAFGTSAKVTIRSPGGGTACADAVRLVPASGAVTPPAAEAVVLDNRDAGAWNTGVWRVSGGLAPWGIDSVYSNVAETDFTFGPTLPAAGSYEVLLWWTEYSSRLRSVPVDIVGSGGTTTRYFDQTQGGGRWNSAGVHAFGTSATIRVRSLGGGSTCADAVKLVPAGGPVTPYEAVIDNGAPGTYSTMTWRVSSGASPYGADSLESQQIAASYQYRFDVPGAGSYEIYLWWTELATRHSQVPVFVRAGSGPMRLLYIDQTRAGGSWNSIGTFPIAGYVKVSIPFSGVGTTCADAARIVRR